MAVNFAAPNRRHRAAVKQASEKLELAATDQSRADSLFVETDIDTVLQQLAAFFRRSARYARLLAEAGNTIGVDVARFPATTPPHLRLRSLRILNMNFLPLMIVATHHGRRSDAEDEDEDVDEDEDEDEDVDVDCRQLAAALLELLNN